MKVSCQACGAKYTIADDKVKGRRVKVRCKSCRAPIVVDGAAPPSDAPPSEAAPPVESESAPAAAAGTWEVNLSDTEQRKMTLDEIREGWTSGLVTPDAYVWKDGFDDWKPILEIPELAALQPAESAATAPAESAAAAQAAAAAPEEPRAMPSPKSPAFPAPPGPKPQPPARPAAPAAPRGGRGAADLFSPAAGEDDKHAGTGARNENSVLFSLDALKAGFTPTGQEPPPRRGAPKKSGLDDLMNIGGNAMMGFDNQALLTAPAPEPPKSVKPAPDASLMGTSTSTASVPEPKKSNKTVLAIGAAVALLAVVGIGFALSGGDEKKEDVTAERAALDETAKTDKAEQKADDPKPAEPAPAAEVKTEDAGAPAAEAAKPDEAKPSDAKPADSKPAEGKAAAKPGPVATKPAEEKKPPPPAAAGGGPFDTAAAKAALGAAAAQAASCKKPGGPTGSGKAVVTFAPSGRVTTANVQGGSFGGTPTGGCVSSVFRRAKVPPFSGNAVTVSKSFTIN